MNEHFGKSAKEVAEHFNVNPVTVRRWVKTGKLPKESYIRFGRTLRFDLELIQRLMKEGATDQPETQPEPQRRIIL